MDRRFSDYGLQRADDGGFDLDGSRRSFPVRILVVFISLAAVLYLIVSRCLHLGPIAQNEQEQGRNTLKGMNLASVVGVGFPEIRDKKSKSERGTSEPDNLLQLNLNRAGTAAAEGKLDESALSYRACLAQNNLSSDIRRMVERRLSDVLLKSLLSPEPGPGKVVYAVQSGDTLDKIAQRFGTITACILHMNGLSDTRLRVGQKLTVLDKPVFEWQQQTESSSLVLYLNGEFLKRYLVSPNGKGVPRLWITLPEGRRLFAFQNVSDAAEIRLFIR